MNVSSNDRVKVIKLNREYTPYELKSISARVVSENYVLLLVSQNKWHIIPKLRSDFANKESGVFVIS